MKDDDIKSKIRSDSLLKKFGGILYQKYGTMHTNYI